MHLFFFYDCFVWCCWRLFGGHFEAEKLECLCEVGQQRNRVLERERLLLELLLQVDLAQLQVKRHLFAHVLVDAEFELHSLV